MHRAGDLYLSRQNGHGRCVLSATLALSGHRLGLRRASVADRWLAPGSYVASSGAAINWQQLVYYSYVTLTTVGYGDITPVGSYAQSVASFEAVLGVLYTVILLSRLVGMRSSNAAQD